MKCVDRGLLNIPLVFCFSGLFVHAQGDCGTSRFPSQAQILDRPLIQAVLGSGSSRSVLRNLAHPRGLMPACPSSIGLPCRPSIPRLTNTAMWHRSPSRQPALNSLLVNPYAKLSHRSMRFYSEGPYKMSKSFPSLCSGTAGSHVDLIVLRILWTLMGH